jgi:hypothetical protein
MDQATTMTDAAAAAAKKPRKPSLHKGKAGVSPSLLKGEEYVAFDAYDQVQTCFNLSPSFDATQLCTRSASGKTVSFVTASVAKELLPAMKTLQMKVVYAGIKMFERHEIGPVQENDATHLLHHSMYRLTQAGASIVMPFLASCATSKDDIPPSSCAGSSLSSTPCHRLIQVCQRDFQMLLERQGTLVSFDAFSRDLAMCLRQCDIGSYVCTLRRDDGRPLTMTECVSPPLM